MANMSRENALGRFEQLVLLAVTSLGPNAYGTPIRRAIEAAQEREVAIGAMYLTLDRMVEKGLLTAALGESTPERGGRAKKFFQLTREGEMALNRSIRSVQRLAPTFAYKEL